MAGPSKRLRLYPELRHEDSDNRCTEEFLDELMLHREFWTQLDEGTDVVVLGREGAMRTLEHILSVRFKIPELTAETLMQEFNQKREWTLAFVARAKRAKVFHLDHMSALYDRAVEDLADDDSAMQALKNYDPVEIRHTLVHLCRVIETARHLMLAHLMAQKMSVPESMFDCVLTLQNDPQSNVANPGENKLRDHQELILYLLDEISACGYRRVDSDLYQQIYVGPYATHAWVKAYSIEQFVHTQCQKETHYYYWNKLTQKLGVAQSVQDFLVRTQDVQIPDLRADRHVLSFLNGYLVCNHTQASPQNTRQLFPQFRSYEDDPARENGADLVSAVLHRLEFPTMFLATSPNDLTVDFVLHGVPTPELDDILDFQKLSPEVKLWVYVFIGRMLFDSNVYDNWQVMPFLKGVAGSGKSTIAYDVIARFYNPEDVFMVSNNCERKFGMQNCLRSDGKGLRYMCVMPEVKQDFGMEQADWQQAVSGERIPINRKHMTTVTETFNLPMFAAGNQMVGYDDNSNSVARRVPVIKFNHPVGGKQDGEKPKKLHAELAHIILKCVYAYAWAVNEYGTRNIWECLPLPFREERQLLVEAQHPLMNYLSSGKVLLKPYLYCPMKHFVQQFKQHVQDNCLSKFQWNADFYDLAFKEHNIKIERNQRIMYDNKRYHATFLRGVDVIDGDSTPAEREYLERAHADSV